MNTALALLIFLAASLDANCAKAQDIADTVEEIVEGLEVTTNVSIINELIPIPALSYMDSEEGMQQIPTVNLSDPKSVLMLQKHINETSCDCTRSGFSGIGVSNDGNLSTYGNTTIVGCAAHSILQREGVGEDINGCYVIGGTACAEATASVLGSETQAFTTAAWRECTPGGLVSKDPPFGWCRWRQTGSCATVSLGSSGSPREPWFDSHCHEWIDGWRSGYCDCDGNSIRDSQFGYVEPTFGCQHFGIKCWDYC